MKFTYPNRNHQGGSVLLVCLLVTLILGITLASYLIMANNQNTSVMRSQVWNSAIPVSEAGVEDALQVLNKYAGDFEKLTNWPSTASSDNWEVVSANVYHVRRYFSDCYYDVYITNTPLMPTIRSDGYTLWRNPYGATAPLFASGTEVYNYGEMYKHLSRKINVKTSIDPLFNVAMAAKQVIDFSGKNVNTDGFDSSDPNYSTLSAYGYGLYPMGLLGKTKNSGDVVTDYTIINSLNVGNAKIKGQVKTGPNGSISIGALGSVGDRAWVEGGNTGIKPGWSGDDMNVRFEDASLPKTTWLTPDTYQTGVKVNGRTYDYVFTTPGDYEIPTFSSIYIGTNAGLVRLKVTGDVNLTGNSDEIRIAPEDARLKLYMTGTTFSMKGNGVVNESGLASNFYYFGLPSNTTLSLGGNANFIGAIYAPSADFQLGGGGNNTFDFIGASVSRTIKMNGHFNFHYDEALRKNGMGQRFVPNNWKES
jgi:hypothetical protein